MTTKYLRVTMPDGSRWDVPVDVIARNRAEHYAHEFGGDVERSLESARDGSGVVTSPSDWPFRDAEHNEGLDG